MTALEALCVQRGLRLTEHRRIVLEVLEASNDHPCVREIHRRAADGHRIGIATVYRTLNTLVEAGMVRRQVFADGKAHYERAGRPVASAPDRRGDRHDRRDRRCAAWNRCLEEEARRLGYHLVDYSLTLFARSDR